MANERVIPTPASSDLPTFKILSGGSEISGEYHVLSILVVKQINKISFAQIILKDGEASAEDFKVSNSEVFVPGKEIEIQAGYHSQNSTIFKGIVIKHAIKVRKDKGSLLIIEMKDKAVKLTIGRKNGYFYDTKDSTVIEDLLRPYGITANVEATDVQHKEMVQYYTTDWDFVVSRAEANGKIVVVDDGQITVKKPDPSQSPALTLVYGATILEFDAEMDARNQFKEIKSNSWDFAGQNMINEEAQVPGFTEHGNFTASKLADVLGLSTLNMQHSGQVADAELKAWASAAMLKSRLAKIRGRARCIGFSGVKCDNVAELKGLGDRFNGKGYVSAIRHQLTAGSWQTDIEFGLPLEWFSRNEDIVEVQAGGLVPAIHGLQIGVVTKLESDPDGEHRVQVRVPVISTQEDGIWARVACLDAGNNRGSFFRPEINDEVILGFINDDPRDAVIVGQLNSSAKPAPLQASDKNPQKGFVTREQLKLIFDDEKKSILLQTPAGHKLLLNDDDGTITLTDKNGNTMKFSSDGINIESIKDIKIKATGDVNVEGVNLSNKANAQFKAEGSAGAKLESSAMAEIKGSLVKIN